MAPKAELGVGKVSLVKLKFKAEAGFELSAEERLGNQGTGLDEIHGCKNCYEGELEFKLTLGVGLKILLYEPKIEITPFSHSFGKAYASADYGDFGWGECPHVKYRLTLKAGKAGAGTTVKIQSNDSDTSSLYTETILDADGNSTVYLPEREYRIIVNKGSMEFVKTIKLSRGTTVNIDLEQGSTGGNPGTTEPDTPDAPTNPDIPTGGTVVASGSCGAKGDNLTWTLDDNGLLTISGTGEMASRCTWSASGVDYSNSIKYVWIKNGVTSIGANAFSVLLNSKLMIVEIPDSVTIIGESAFMRCNNLQEITLPESVTRIEWYAFKDCTNLESVSIPQSILGIESAAFSGCDRLKDVYYSGTKNAWNIISISYGNGPLSAATIHCTDGDIIPNTENSITTGAASTLDSKFQATFANAKAGKEYVVLVSRSGSDPLNADNLIYINQITADADGELAVPFITAADAAEMTYVVACAQDDATVDPDQPDKPNQPDQPDQPGGDEPSSGGGDGGGAIILIGGVIAVAAVAGAVLLMPVKVEGTVKLADQPVANATVQVLKGDAVKAETVTDANGHFTVKVERGGYTLRVQWTDASGQPVTRTVDFKAPNANLNVAA